MKLMRKYKFVSHSIYSIFGLLWQSTYISTLVLGIKKCSSRINQEEEQTKRV